MQNTILVRAASFSKFLSIASAVMMMHSITAVADDIDNAVDPVSITQHCNIGLVDTWIVTKVCNIGGGTDIKVDDAIDIRCDSVTNQWSVDFYEEIQGQNDFIRYDICENNGYLEIDEMGQTVMRCNYWDTANGLDKQLEFVMDLGLQSQAAYAEKAMTWKAIELDNPNVICGIAARPEGGTGDAGSGRTVNGG